MKDILVNICDLQPKYSSSNTNDMKIRGSLIRSELSQELKNRLPTLQRYFDKKFNDLDVDASDGIGRKTEAPWVRVYSKKMSPNPRDGFYIVIHFSADGAYVFFTIGCGSTTWNGDDLRPISDNELRRKTEWAKTIIFEKWNTLEPFNDQIALGAKAPLPKTFEKATALAKKISKIDLPNIDIERILSEASIRLNEIYLAQLEKRDLSPGVVDINELNKIIRPLAQKKSSQGYGLTGSERKAVEYRAMELAAEYLEQQGYTYKDTSKNESFDYLAEKDGRFIKVEVKGTTSDLCDTILMTKNEVELHRSEKGSTGLIIVSSIKLSKMDDSPKAEHGKIEALLFWDIDDWISQPIAFQVSRIGKN